MAKKQDIPVQPDVPEVVYVKDDKTEEKPRVFDIDKSWKEQLTPEEIKRIKDWAGRVVKQWHDEVKPDYIFLTETSAIPFGYVLKEAWKTAYNDEEIPKFYRVDPSFLMNTFGPGMKDDNPYYIKEEAILKEHFNALITKNNPNIIVFDEGGIISGNLGSRDQKSYDDFLYRYTDEDKKEDKSNRAPVFRDIMHTRSQRIVMKYLDVLLKDKNPSIYGSQQAITEVLRGEEVECDIGEKEKEFTPFKWETKMIKNRKPTSKPYSSRDRDIRTQDMIIQNLSGGHHINKFDHPKIKGRIVKHPEQRKRAIEYVNELQELGREAGEELRVELEKKKEEGGN